MDDRSPILQAADPPLVVLASASPTRERLLRSAGLPVQVLPASIDETSFIEAMLAEEMRAEDGAVALAELKAQRVAGEAPAGSIVLGADQLLEVDGSWYEKPPDRAAARAQLLRLQGKRHRLISAVVAFRNGARVWHAVDVATIAVRPFSEAWLDAYLDSVGEQVLGSAGAYQLEGLGAQMISSVEGSHFTVLGLPLLPLLQFLREQGVLVP
jgi:septum formation protein